MRALAGRDVLTRCSEGEDAVPAVIDAVANGEASGVFADVFDSADGLIARTQGIGTVVELAGDGGKFRADADAGIPGLYRDLVGAWIGKDDVFAGEGGPLVGDECCGFQCSGSCVSFIDTVEMLMSYPIWALDDHQPYP